MKRSLDRIVRASEPARPTTGDRERGRARRRGAALGIFLADEPPRDRRTPQRHRERLPQPDPQAVDRTGFWPARALRTRMH